MVRTNSPLRHMVSVINHDKVGIRFLIMDCPTETTLPLYADEFLEHNVTTVVRCCASTYSSDLLLNYGIDFLDLPFRDGGVPNSVIVAQWIALIDKHTSDPLYSIEKPTIAVHCVAGLGRAPVLVALALLEMGVNPLDAIDFIRQRRRGAFNKLQIHYLDQYKRTTKYRRLSSGSSHSSTSSSTFFSWGGRVLSKLTNKGGIHGTQQQEQHYQQSV